MPVAKYNGITLNLGGTDYVLPPISLGALEQLQSNISKFSGDVMDATQITTVIDAAHASLLRNYPGITRTEVADMIDVGNMSDVFAAVMDVSGLKRKELAEANPAGEAVAG